MNRHKWFIKLFFVFTKIFNHNVRKSRVRVAVDYANTQIFPQVRGFSYLNYCYWVCKHTQVLFSPDCFFKICEKPSKFSSAQSLSCLRSQRLSRHLVRVVNDFTDTMSAQSTTKPKIMYTLSSTTTPRLCPYSQHLYLHVSTQSTTTPTWCKHSQQLHGHAIFENKKLNLSYFYL